MIATFIISTFGIIGLCTLALTIYCFVQFARERRTAALASLLLAVCCLPFWEFRRTADYINDDRQGKWGFFDDRHTDYDFGWPLRYGTTQNDAWPYRFNYVGLLCDTSLGIAVWSVVWFLIRPRFYSKPHIEPS